VPTFFLPCSYELFYNDFNYIHMSKKTLVIGASNNPERYAFRAVKKLTAYGHPVLALGKKEEMIDAVPVVKERPLDTDIDTVTLYVNPQLQKNYYDYILQLHPKRIIFNPGTENDELADLAEKNGIETIEACTLVMLSIGDY
jgi:predicted CoA-binding protein